MSDALNAIIPDSHRDILTSTALAHVATIDPTGAPQANPVWFDWDGTYLRIAVAPNSQKARNLRRDPRVAISMVDAANPGRYLEVRGRAVAFDPDPDRIGVRRIIRKYTGADELPGETTVLVVVAIEPIHTTQMG